VGLRSPIELEKLGVGKEQEFRKLEVTSKRGSASGEVRAAFPDARAETVLANMNSWPSDVVATSRLMAR
jgi:hypothetical protein